MADREYPQDMEERTFEFAEDVRGLLKQLPRTEGNAEDIPQLVRASGSVAANYIEGNDSLGKKDFLMRMRIARKEAKESRLFLRLIDCGQREGLEEERDRLVRESVALKLILSAIIKNSGG